VRLRKFGTTALSVVLLAVQSLYAPYRNAGKRVPPPTTTVSEDHVRLAAYFSELASQERILADSYSRLATSRSFDRRK
jgi:hypothetical protein